ncbi:regulator of microtubule dynamics protein 1 [Chrysochromulina tobinii]|uniref:Regulator of microtubule dynamics protein 1 n=1 Tax=Chrysochromulina tobinii TaxID=1460289 RepID=A0A0M0JBE7_9EUKA|nr:regulator of microtubule dynamics protein 1 [Chrysochromulina tobinii]|eukprot:KOO23815.1 regulator of microtubule dynamics protein 1 [Chrysochromulina sp. CCMP291]
MRRLLRPLVCCSAPPLLRVATRTLRTAAAIAVPTPSGLFSCTAAALAAAAATAATSALTPSQSKAAPPPTAEADRLFDANQYEPLATLLRASLAKAPDDTELLWRLARVCKKLADEEKPKSAAKQALIREGVQSSERALALKPDCGPAHKWQAIMLSEVGHFEGTTTTIKNSFVVRAHFEKAVELSPKDATSRHLLGLWCFEVAKLGWLEKKAAAALFATPPTATFEEALGHFEAAEAIDPGFYPKNLLLMAMAHAKLGHKAEAEQWRQRCLAAKPRTPEDEQTRKEAEKWVP